MIIKSMARKAATFSQLIAYFEGEAEPNRRGFHHNLYDGMGPHGVDLQFRANWANLPKRRNGNALYHEIISLLPQPHLSNDELTVSAAFAPPGKILAEVPRE